MDETGGTKGPAGGSNTGAPQHAGAADSVPARQNSDGAMKQDIQKILADSKLPERREGKLRGEHVVAAEVKPIDALLTAGAPPIPVAAETEHAVTPEQARVVSLHTLKNDLQDVVRDQKISVVHASALEEEKRGKTVGAVPEPPHSHRLRTALTVVGFLSALGLAALLGVYYIVEQKSAPIQPQQSDSLVFAESSVPFVLDSQATPEIIKAGLATARQKSGSLGSIARVVPMLSTTTPDGGMAQVPATFSQFMGAIGAHVPDELLRALSDTFFLGIHTVDKNAPVIIVPVTSYEHAFNGMLSWEAFMNGDLSPLFTPVSQYVTVDGVPTQRAFSDSVFRNYDVRQLADDSGSIVLYYSFPTRNILIIAESPYTFTEILTRLQAQRAL